MKFVIQNVNDKSLYWNNEDGWVKHLECADFFNEDERKTLNLPLEGTWFHPKIVKKDGPSC